MYCFKMILILCAAISLGLEARASAPGPSREKVGVQAEKAGKSQEEKKAPAPKNSVRRITHFVKKIEGGVLYTEKNQYNLSGVKVLDLSPKPKNTVIKGMPKKTAEMTFLNGQLREVVIRQRQ